ncbi:hypothetical protein ABIE67_002193 [Streptomyces sp. V4I8]|uniref:hypothetical protein n=1 Tax=Streptomyces sp. V4I8 TaxID=3156469 RepID=UPI00351220BA
MPSGDPSVSNPRTGHYPGAIGHGGRDALLHGVPYGRVAQVGAHLLEGEDQAAQGDAGEEPRTAQGVEGTLDQPRGTGQSPGVGRQDGFVGAGGLRPQGQQELGLEAVVHVGGVERRILDGQRAAGRPEQIAVEDTQRTSSMPSVDPAPARTTPSASAACQAVRSSRSPAYC